MKFAPPAPPFIAARWKGGKQTPRRIVMHSTVGPTKVGSAKAIAHYFARGERKSSAHYVVDELEKYQCVGDHTVAWHCGYNQDSIGVEMCDYPSATSKARWRSPEHQRMFVRTARLVARLCLAYDIPPYYVGVFRLRLGRKGVTTHAAMTRAFNRSTHWDPGAWPRYRFMREVRAQIKRMKAAQS